MPLFHKYMIVSSGSNLMISTSIVQSLRNGLGTLTYPTGDFVEIARVKFGEAEEGTSCCSMHLIGNFGDHNASFI